MVLWRACTPLIIISVAKENGRFRISIPLQQEFWAIEAPLWKCCGLSCPNLNTISWPSSPKWAGIWLKDITSHAGPNGLSMEVKIGLRIGVRIKMSSGLGGSNTDVLHWLANDIQTRFISPYHSRDSELLAAVYLSIDTSSSWSSFPRLPLRGEKLYFLCRVVCDDMCFSKCSSTRHCRLWRVFWCSMLSVSSHTATYYKRIRWCFKRHLAVSQRPTLT